LRYRARADDVPLTHPVAGALTIPTPNGVHDVSVSFDDGTEHHA
jgi:hypothetical protein